MSPYSFSAHFLNSVVKNSFHLRSFNDLVQHPEALQSQPDYHSCCLSPVTPARLNAWVIHARLSKIPLPFYQQLLKNLWLLFGKVVNLA